MADLPVETQRFLRGLFPVEGQQWRLELGALGAFSRGSGLLATLRVVILDDMGDVATTMELEAPLLRGDDVTGDWAKVMAALRQWRNRISTMSSIEVEQGGPPVVLPWGEVADDENEKRYGMWLHETWDEPEHLASARRAKAMNEAKAAFPKLRDHVLDVWGLLIPESLVALDGFFRALRPLPAEIREAGGVVPAGILDRLAPGGFDRKPLNGLDERLHARFRKDPPELLTFAYGDSDGLHFGFWFDTAEGPAGVVHNYARDSAETWWTGLHPMSVARHAWVSEPVPDDESGFAARRFLEEVKYFETEETLLITDLPDTRRRKPLLGGPMGTPEALLPFGVDKRAAMYREPDSAMELVGKALDALEAGNPAFALAVGRELFWIDDPRIPEGVDLMRAAYDALGRPTHKDILEAHIKNRDLRSVDLLGGR